MKNYTIFPMFLVIFLCSLIFQNDSYAADMSKISTTSIFQQTNPFHEGEVPLQRVVDKKTGVVAELYQAPELQPYTAGSWDKIGSEPWYTYAGVQIDGIHPSHGGDYMIQIPPHSISAQSHTLLLLIDLYEADPEPNLDDYLWTGAIDYKNSANPSKKYDLVFRNIGKYVDGINGEAEFYTKHQFLYSLTSGHSVTVQYFD